MSFTCANVVRKPSTPATSDNDLREGSSSPPLKYGRSVQLVRSLIKYVPSIMMTTCSRRSTLTILSTRASGSVGPMPTFHKVPMIMIDGRRWFTLRLFGTLGVKRTLGRSGTTSFATFYSAFGITSTVNVFLTPSRRGKASMVWSVRSVRRRWCC